MAEEKMTPKEMYNEAWLYYLTGNFTLVEIAEHLNINKQTLYTYAGRNSWSRRARDIQAKAGRGLKQSLMERIEKERIKHIEFALDQLNETGEAIALMKIGQENEHARKGKNGKKPVVTVNDKLELLDSQDKIARRVLKLDDEEKTDPNDIGFRQLVGLGVSIHLHNSEATTGILSSNNAHLEGLQESDFYPLEVTDGEARPLESNESPMREEPASPKSDKVELKFV